jgi:hypothetical protein
MRKVSFLLLALLLFISRPCRAVDYNDADLLSLVNLTPATATQGKITSMLGKPGKIEESKKRTSWYYTSGNTVMVISWSKKSELLEKFSFSCTCTDKCVFDQRLSRKLKSGSTNIVQAMKLLGQPEKMTIKETKQEMHYAYRNNVLRLFFRDRVLVDFCLY